ncbi:MAG: hypothetical protein SNJ72_08785 [Fimbriimonadales bacterium]
MRVWLISALSALLLLGVHAQQRVVMMPDSTNNRLVLFSPVDGSLINPNLFALAGSTPLHAIQIGREIWVSEQLGDRISRWSLSGTQLGQIGPSGLDNIRGMARVGDRVYVTNFGIANGAPGAAIVIFSTQGDPLGFFSTTTTSSSPFAILDYEDSLLVASANANDDIHRYTYAGASLGTFYNSTSLNFAEQMAYAQDGNILVAGFSSNNVVKLNRTTGAVVDSFPAAGARGVYQLENGNILWTNSAGAHIFDVSTRTSTLIYSGGGRFLDLLVIPPQGDVNADGCVDDADLLAVLFAFGSEGTGLPEDINEDGVVDDADLLIVLFNFGTGC